MKFSNLYPKKITTYLLLTLIFGCNQIDEEIEPIIIEPSPLPGYVYLDENGVTMKAGENSQPGEIATFDGASYLIVDKETLHRLVRGYPGNGVDLSKLVTSKVTDMS